MPDRNNHRAAHAAIVSCAHMGDTHMSKSVATVTLHVMGGRQYLTLTEKIAIAGGTAFVWPQPVPVYRKGVAAKAERTRNYWTAVGEAGDVHTALAGVLANGGKLTVIVNTGAILTADRERNVYSNVVAGSMLRELCEAAEDVIVRAGAEDPRDYVSEDPDEDAIEPNTEPIPF